MPEFYYEAIPYEGKSYTGSQPGGSSTSGTLVADSELDAAEQLAACELMLQRGISPPPSLAEVGGSGPAPQSEMRETLELLAQATLNAKLRREIRQFLSNEKSGTAPGKQSEFVNGLSAHCRSAGDPLSALGPLIEFERDLGRVKNDSSGRFIYAYGLLLFASCLFSFTDYFVGETFRAMFREFSLRLPAVTLFMLHVGPLFWSLTISLIALPILIQISRVVFRHQIWFDRGLDSVIMWGPWRRWRYSAQALAYLGSMLKSGATLPNACDAAAEILPRPFNAWQLRKLADRIEAGASLESACATAKIHQMVIPFLLASERQSRLAEGCLSGAGLLLERCRRRRMFFAYFIETFAMVFVLITALSLFASYMWPVFMLLTSLRFF